MVNPYIWVKRRWYRRQARRAIWFLRYVDQLCHDAGWNRGQRKKFWDDFIKFPVARNATLNQMSVMNKITIREAKKARYQRHSEFLQGQVVKLNLELNKLRAEHAQCVRPEQTQEVPHEVHDV